MESFTRKLPRSRFPQTNLCQPLGGGIHMPVDFYAAFFNLTADARAEFEFLVEDDDTLENTVADCADLWRGKMRVIYQDPILCRHVFLARSTLIAAKGGIKNGYGCQVAAAFALYLCDRIERRVRELDFEANQHSIFENES